LKSDIGLVVSRLSLQKMFLLTIFHNIGIVDLSSSMPEDAMKTIMMRSRTLRVQAIRVWWPTDKEAP
jgi:hypothetical protein